MEDGTVGELCAPLYRARTLSEVPAAAIVSLPTVVERGYVVVMLAVELFGETPWFAEARVDEAQARFWATCDPYVFCVTFGRSAYWIDARQPGCVGAHEVNFAPWERAGFLRSHDLLLTFPGGIAIAAYDRHGVRWTSGRLALDEISELEIAGDVVRGVADSLGDEWVPFTVDVATGRKTGGFPGWDAFNPIRLE